MYRLKQVLLLGFILTQSPVSAQDIYAYISDSSRGQLFGINLDERKATFEKILDFPDKRYLQFVVDPIDHHIYFRDSSSIYQHDLSTGEQKVLHHVSQPFYNWTYAAHEQLFYFTIDRINSYDLWSMNRDAIVQQRSIILRDDSILALEVYPGPFGKEVIWQELRTNKKGKEERYILRLDASTNVMNEFSVKDIGLPPSKNWSLDRSGKNLYYATGSGIYRTKKSGGEALPWITNAEAEEPLIGHISDVCVLHDEDGEGEQLYAVDAKLGQLTLCKLDGEEQDRRKYEVEKEIPKDLCTPYEIAVVYQEWEKKKK